MNTPSRANLSWLLLALSTMFFANCKSRTDRSVAKDIIGPNSPAFSIMAPMALGTDFGGQVAAALGTSKKLCAAVGFLNGGVRQVGVWFTAASETCPGAGSSVWALQVLSLRQGNSHFLYLGSNENAVGREAFFVNIQTGGDERWELSNLCSADYSSQAPYPCSLNLNGAIPQITFNDPPAQPTGAQ